MRASIVELIEAVRAFGTYVVETKAGDRRVRIGCDPSEFPDRLGAAHDALLAVDADGGIGDPSEDPARMREALVAVMRFAILRGLDQKELEDVVRLSVDENKPKAAATFTLQHKPFRPRRKWKPQTTAGADRLSFLSSDATKRMANQNRGEVLDRMGSAAPRGSDF